MTEFTKEERLALLLELDSTASMPIAVQVDLEGEYKRKHIELIQTIFQRLLNEAHNLDGLTKEAYRKAIREHTLGPSTS